MSYVHTFTTKSCTVITIITLVGVLAVFSVPQKTNAATYAYVTKSGDLNILVASSPRAALRSAINIALDSGVILLSNAFNNTVVNGKLISL